jgi:hypothetical protein
MTPPEAEAARGALLEQTTTAERDLARQTEEEHSLAEQLAAENTTSSQLAYVIEEDVSERESVTGSDVEFEVVFRHTLGNDLECFEDEAPTEISLGAAPEVHHAVEALRGEVAAAKARLEEISTKRGALSQAAVAAYAALAESHASTQSLHTKLLNAKAERILLQAEVDGEEEDDETGGRDLSTEDVNFDAVFNGGDALPRHHNSAAHQNEGLGSFEQDSPNTLALPLAARVEMARLRGILETTRMQLKEVLLVFLSFSHRCVTATSGVAVCAQLPGQM